MKLKLSFDALLHPSGYDLVTAAKNNDPDTVKTLLSSDPALVFFTRQFSGQTALHVAALNGSSEAITEITSFLRQSADKLARLPHRASCFSLLESEPGSTEVTARAVNQQNSQQQTALMLAAASSNAHCVHLLLEAGADIQAKDSGLRTALHYAAFSGCTAAAASLLTVAEQLSVSHPRPAAFLARFIDRRTLCGFTALHYAVYHGNADTAQHLLFAGASPFARCTWAGSLEGIWCDPGTTPMHLAARCGHLTIAKLILQALVARTGTLSWAPTHDPRQLRDRNGRQPYHHAMAMRRTQLAHLLHPTTALSEMFTADELAGLLVETFPSLAALAANAHRVALRAQLREVCPRVYGGQEEDEKQADLNDGQATTSGSVLNSARALSSRARKVLRSKLRPKGKAALQAMQASMAEQAGEEGTEGAEGDASCGVCYSHMPEVQMEGCAHTLCGDCCSRICDTEGAKTPLCPFCRQNIKGFAAITVTPTLTAPSHHAPVLHDDMEFPPSPLPSSQDGLEDIEEVYDEFEGQAVVAGIRVITGGSSGCSSSNMEVDSVQPQPQANSS